MTWGLSASTGSKTGCRMNWKHAFNAEEIFFSIVVLQFIFNLIYRNIYRHPFTVTSLSHIKTSSMNLKNIEVQAPSSALFCFSSSHFNSPPAAGQTCSYQLLLVNIFRISRSYIKFSTTCWGKGDRRMPTLWSQWTVVWSLKHRARCQNLTGNPPQLSLLYLSCCPVTMPATQSP